MRNSSLGPPWGIILTTHRTMCRCSTTELHLTPTGWNVAHWVHHEGLFWRPIALWADALQQSYISLWLVGMWNSSLGRQWWIVLTTHRTMSRWSDLLLEQFSGPQLGTDHASVGHLHHWATMHTILDRQEENVLFNDTLNTFYLITRHMIKDQSDSDRTCSPTSVRNLLYASSRQDSTFHSLCYTSCGSLAGLRNSSIGPWWGSIWCPITPVETG